MNKLTNVYLDNSPLIDNNNRMQIAPFYFDKYDEGEDEDELAYNYNICPINKSEEPKNINLKVVTNQEKLKKEENSLSLSITNKISGIIHSKVFTDSISLDVHDIINDCQKGEKPEKNSKTTDLTHDKEKLVKSETKNEKKILGVKTGNEVVM